MTLGESPRILPDWVIDRINAETQPLRRRLQRLQSVTKKLCEVVVESVEYDSWPELKKAKEDAAKEAWRKE